MWSALPLMAAAGALAVGAPAASRAAPAAPAATSHCAPEGALRLICGIKSPEDLVSIPGANWILSSSMDPDGPGGLYLIDARTQQYRRLYPAKGAEAKPQRQLYPDCAGPPDPTHFATHGLSIRSSGPGRATLYVIGHGGREAVEVFELATGGVRPKITWVGCVNAPKGSSLNSVAGGRASEIVVTSLLDGAATFQDILAGRPTGAVYARGPGEAFRKLPGTVLSGDNGIEVSPDGKWLFVAATGARKVFRFDRANLQKAPASVDVGVLADNLRWAPDGRLLVAGERPETGCGAATCPSIYGVLAIDPVSLKAASVASGRTSKNFSGLSSALLVGDVLWLGAHQGDRIAFTPAR